MADVQSKLILPAFFIAAVLSLACGGGETTSITSPSEEGDLSQTTASRPASDKVGVKLSSEPLAKWADPLAQAKARLTSLGWTVDSCEMFKDGGEVYYNCSANKGEQWADVDISDLADTQSAEWQAEDNPSALRDGKRVIEVTVFDGAAGKVLGELILPPGKKLDTVDMNAASATFESKGWAIEEVSSSSSSGYTSLELIGVKGGNVLVFEIDMLEGEPLSRDTRSIEEGMFFVEQADESFLTVAVLDEAQGTTLLQAMFGN
ncbi:MAG: hypothetical protein ACI9VR_002161 [Cognaticolwellia sp.]|jgi:hypothetical protein